MDRLVGLLNNGIDSVGLIKMMSVTDMSAEEIQRVRTYNSRFDENNVRAFCKKTGINSKYILERSFPIYMSG